MKLQLKRSNVLVSGGAKEPTAAQLDYGELAINYSAGDAAIFLKDSTNNVIRIAGVHNIADDGLTNVPTTTSPPTTPTPEDGNLWYNSEDGRLYIYYVDANSSQWVDASPDTWQTTVIPDTTNPAHQAGTLDDRYVNINGDTLTGALLLDNAAAAATPDLAFDGDLNTGIFSPGADSLAITTAGSQRVTVDSSGNVLIGTTSAATNAKVTVRATSPQLSLHATPGNISRITLGDTDDHDIGQIGYDNTDNSIFLVTNNATRMSIDSSGKVGIGNTSPAASLQITPGTGAGTLLIDNASGSVSDGALNIEVNSSGAFYETRKTGGLAHIWYATGVERMRIDSSGRLLVGLSTGSGEPIAAFQGRSNDASDSGIVAISRTGTNPSGSIGEIRFATGSDLNKQYATLLCQSDGSTTSTSLPGLLRFNTTASGATSPTERMRIDSSGKVGIGLTNPSQPLSVVSSQSAKIQFGLASDQGGFLFSDSAGGFGIAGGGYYNGSSWIAKATASSHIRDDGNGTLMFYTNSSLTAGNAFTPTERMRIYGSDGGVSVKSYLEFANQAGSGYSGYVGNAADLIASGSSADLGVRSQQNLIFAAGGSSERMRIDSSGNTSIGKAGYVSRGTDGHYFGNAGWAHHSVNNDSPLWLNRNSSDGKLIDFSRAGATAGYINVSGGTVTLVGAHLSRWSQLPGGKERVEILRGSILSNLDEMCEWGDEDNEQLNRMKLSDVEGDKNVSGVFDTWDNDDKTYTNDLFCAMTGDFVIRIAEGTTVERGDLLMSAGDGTAKPQEDDIVRSKTIAKVTSTTVSETYADNSYCVPCVLMAC